MLAAVSNQSSGISYFHTLTRITLRKFYYLSKPLRKNKPAFLILGANTDVGKTVVSTGLCLASASANGVPFYVKPFQTGEISDANFVFSKVQTIAKLHLSCIQQPKTMTLFQFSSPVSPHMAAQERDAPSDQHVIASLEEQIRSYQSQESAMMLVEGAGGVLSPTPSGSSQADLFRELRLPVILVGDGRLGGISTTLSAYESLIIRGYNIAAVVTIQGGGDLDLGNNAYFSEKLGNANCKVIGFPSLPELPAPLEPWLIDVLPEFQRIVSYLSEYHLKQVSAWASASQDATSMIWWPFTQHQSLMPQDVMLVDSAFKDNLHVVSCDGENNDKQFQSQKLFDGCGSWWTNGVGHGNIELTLAAAAAAGRYGHVIFAGVIHEPALELAKAILKGPGKAWASKVFFSDDGSTAIELGIKMAFRMYLKKIGCTGENAPQLSAITQNDSYHGDTLGCMNLSVQTVFTQGQHPWHEPRNLSMKVPTLGWKDDTFTLTIPVEIADNKQGSGPVIHTFCCEAQAFDLVSRESLHKTDNALIKQMYVQYISGAIDQYHRVNSGCHLGALVVEPLLLGAGGMILVDPLFQRIVVQECKNRGIPVIYDEVFSGLWRLGVQSAREVLGVDPDIACFGKLLTGGVVPLAVTVCSEGVFEAFKGASKADALLHGHSFTAHPVGCAVAVKALNMYKQSKNYDTNSGTLKEFWLEQEVREISKLKNIKRAIRIGTVLALELETSDALGYSSAAGADILSSLKQSGIYLRSLGNVLYAMASPVSSRDECRVIYAKLYQKLSESTEKQQEANKNPFLTSII